MSDHGTATTLHVPVVDAVARTREALAGQGVGVLTDGRGPGCDRRAGRAAAVGGPQQAQSGVPGRHGEDRGLAASVATTPARSRGRRRCGPRRQVKVVSERRGHASATITLTVHQHVHPGMGRPAADRFAEFLRG